MTLIIGNNFNSCFASNLLIIIFCKISWCCQDWIF